MKRLIIYSTFVALVLVIATIGVRAQTQGQGAQSYVETIRRAMDQSLDLKAQRTLLTSDSLAARRGLNPDDPEVAMDYYFGQRGGVELTLEQSFDFPVVYHQRNQLSKLSIGKSQAAMALSGRGLMLEVSDVYLAQINLWKLRSMLTDRAERIKQLNALTTRSVEQGQSTLVDLTQSQAMLVSALNELQAVDVQLAQGARMLDLLTAGTLRVDSTTVYPVLSYDRSSDEFIDRVLGIAPESRVVELDSLVARRTLTLSRWEWAPKIKIGYKAEFEGASPRHALLAGLSIPLWQNRGNVEHSKALMASAAAQNANTLSRLRLSLGELYGQWQTNVAAFRNFENVLSSQNQEAILQTSIESGSITMLEALLLTESWWTSQREMMESRHAAVQSTASLLIFESVDSKFQF